MFSSKLLQYFYLVDSPLGLYCGRRSTTCANQPPVALYPVDHQLVIDSYLTYLGKTILPDEELVWKEALSIHTKKEELKFTASLYKSASKPACQMILRNLRIPDNLPDQTTHIFSPTSGEFFLLCGAASNFFNPNLAPGPVKLWKPAWPLFSQLTTSPTWSPSQTWLSGGPVYLEWGAQCSCNLQTVKTPSLAADLDTLSMQK